jgi:hypothetical protein
MKQMILDSVSNLVRSFLYYDRVEDEELPMDAIEKAIKDGEITPDEIIKFFGEKLLSGLDLDSDKD